jgi:radical SAM superfamily enzyme YgiQ (UPF0313 family)
MSFGGLNRFDHLLHPGLLDLYRRAGFRYFYCAIEQFDDASLSHMNKAQDTKRIRTAMNLLAEFGFMVGVSLLYGLPYETEQSINRTLDFTAEWVDQGTIRIVSESIFSFHPGTPAGNDTKIGFDRTPPNKGFPFDRFEEGQWEHHEHVTGNYLERILRLSEKQFGNVMVRNRHSWYANKGYVMSPARSLVSETGGYSSGF